MSSSSQQVTAIFMTDTPKEIATKINKHAFSGGQESIEAHRAKGANLQVDIPYQYLRFFLDDDEELEQIGEEYGKGRLLTGQVKQRCIAVLQEFVAQFQARRAAVTDDTVAYFMSIRPPKN